MNFFLLLFVKFAKYSHMFSIGSVAFPLPFSDDTFDLVRLSNLTEAIPQHRWEHVLREIRRVLMPFGE